jgi:predicted transposase YbfD/YdcC
MTSSLALDLDRYRVAATIGLPVPHDLVPHDLGAAWDWAPQIVVLAEELAWVRDPRRCQGRRHDLVFLLLVLVMAVITGATSMAAVLRWAKRADPRVLVALARGGPTAVAAYTTFSRLLSRLDGDEVDDAFSRFTARVLAPGDLCADPLPPDLFAPDVFLSEPVLPEPVLLQPVQCDPVEPEAVEPEAVAVATTTAGGARRSPVRAWSLDGKTVRGAGTATTRAPHLVSVLRHDTNTVAAQRLVDIKTNEITVFQDVLDVIPSLGGDIILADALHTQRAHATYLNGRGAYYLFPVAENQPKLFDAVNTLAWETTPIAFEDTVKGHGRTTKRTTKVLPAPEDLPFPHACQVILTERLTTGRIPGTTEAVAALAITAAPADVAGPADLAAHIRNHWRVEVNHYIRDVTYREDASQARTNSTPRIMASARNQAINLIQVAGFTSIPEGNDHYKAHPEQALELLGLTM